MIWGKVRDEEELGGPRRGAAWSWRRWLWVSLGGGLGAVTVHVPAAVPMPGLHASTACGLYASGELIKEFQVTV